MDEYIRSRTEITIETHSITTIKTRGASGKLSHCDICLRSTQPLEKQILIGDFGRGVRSVERLLSDGSIHKLSNGEICSNSLAVYLDSDIRRLDNKPKQENQK